MKNVRWTHYSVKLEALKYKKRGEWAKASHGSYAYAKKHGLVEECTKHMTPHFLWTYETVQKEALKYKSLRDWTAASIGSYQYAVRNKLIKEFSQHMVNPRVIWNYETVKNEALKYKSTKEWIIQSHGSYVWASKYRLVDEFSAHMIDLRKNRSFRKDNPHLFTKTTTEVKKINLPPKSRPSKTNWDDQSVKIEALKHQKRSLWSAASPSSYRYAKRNSKLFTECTKHMGPPLTGKKRTKKECIQSAKKYKTVADWKIGDSKCHNFAKKHGWFNECSKHMKKTNSPGFWMCEKNIIKEMKKYSSRREFIQANPTAYGSALKHFKTTLDQHFPIIEYASTSLGEYATKLFLEKIFQTEFVKKKHDFLINPKTNRELELDGYCEKLKIAFEYGDHLELKERVGDDQILAILEKDEHKKQTCKELHIALLLLTVDSLRFKNPSSHLKAQIKKELIRNKIKIPECFESTPLEIVQFKQKKWNKEAIWEAVKLTRNIWDLQKSYGGAYGAAVRLDIIDEIRLYYKTNKQQ